MTYDEAVRILDELPFLYRNQINYGVEYSFSLDGTFNIIILQTFLTKGYAVCYCIDGWGGDFSFEEFYDRMPKEMQENIIFNIGDFQRINAEQCNPEDRQDIIDWVEIISEEYREAFESLNRDE